MPVVLRNNATTTLASSITALSTSIALKAGDGGKFPAPGAGEWFPVTLVKADNSNEIVRCTARTGDVLTVARAQEGTLAQVFSAGDRVELRITAAVLAEQKAESTAAQEAADAAQAAADTAQDTAQAITDLAVKKDAAATTGAAVIPVGTEAQRPGTPANGMFRYNSEKNQFEGYQNGKWGQVGGGDPLFSVMWWPQRSAVPAGYVAADGQSLSRATYPDAWAGINAGSVPTVAEATWQSTNTERGKFTVGDGSTTFRLPDYNGKFAGSLGAVFLRGDGTLSAGQVGMIQRDAFQGHHHNQNFQASFTGGAGTGARSLALGSSGTWGDSVLAPITDGVNGAPRTSSETRPLNVTGCWVIKLFGAVVNVGSADAAQLASDYANLAAALSTLDSQIDFTIIYPNGGSEASPANVGVNSRYVMPNPFPGHFVVCEAEVLAGLGWGNPGFMYSSGSGSSSFGTAAHQLSGAGIIVQTGTNAVGALSIYTGSPFAQGSNLGTAPCRVKVWKVKGATA